MANGELDPQPGSVVMSVGLQGESEDWPSAVPPPFYNQKIDSTQSGGHSDTDHFAILGH